MGSPIGWLRQHRILLVVVAAVVWIATIVVLITLNPVAGTGNPMD